MKYHTMNTRSRRGSVVLLLLATVAVLAGSGYLALDTLRIRYQRDVTRMVFNDNIELLDMVRQKVGYSHDSLSGLLTEATYETSASQPYIVISVEENMLWYRLGDSTIMEARVATGSGKTLVTSGSATYYKFNTPRGRLVVERKDMNPVWVPPDWHYEEQAKKRGATMTKMSRGETFRSADGSVLAVSGNDIVLRQPNGEQKVMTATDGREIVFDGKLIVPPFGTNQRKYDGVLGTRRLYLGDGYGIHGTNNPASIGQSVSHGCVRMLNEEIEKLYEMVELGTPVFIY